MVVIRRDDNVERFSRNRVVTGPNPTQDGTPVQAAAAQQEKFDTVTTEVKVKSQTLSILEASNIPLQGQAGVQPTFLGIISMAPRLILARGGHLENRWQTGSHASTVTYDVSLGSPERTVHCSDDSDANAVRPPCKERATFKHPRPREQDATIDHSVKKAEEGGPPWCGKDLQMNTIVSADPTLVNTRKTTPGVPATRQPALAESSSPPNDPWSNSDYTELRREERPRCTISTRALSSPKPSNNPNSLIGKSP